MAIGEQVEVPADVLVRCPLLKFDLRAAGECDECPHFGGLTEMIAGGSQPFHRRFAVNCRHGIDRELYRLAAKATQG